MILWTLRPEISPASLLLDVEHHLKYAGTVTTASVTDVPK